MGGVGLRVGDGRWQVALQADGVDVGQVQELGIVAAVWRVARRAAYLFDSSVFVHPRAGQIGVALQTGGCLLRDSRLQARFKCAVRIVTGGALDGTVIDLMMHWRGELGLDTGVTLVAEDRLRRLQQLPFLACVDGMTTGAADVGCGVSRSREVGVLAGVAGEAGGVRVFG